MNGFWHCAYKGDLEDIKSFIKKHPGAGLLPLSARIRWNSSAYIETVLLRDGHNQSWERRMRWKAPGGSAGVTSLMSSDHDQL